MPSPIHTIFVATLLGTLVTAPMQCARDPGPERAIEEEPGEAIYGLAEQFRDKGDVDARKATLLYLVKRFPSSRFAARAKQDLAELGVPPDQGSSR